MGQEFGDREKVTAISDSGKKEKSKAKVFILLLLAKDMRDHFYSS